MTSRWRRAATAAEPLGLLRRLFGGTGEDLVPVTPEQMGALLVTAAAKGAFDGDNSLADQVLAAAPEVAEDHRFRAELLIVSLLPLDMIASKEWGRFAPAVRDAMLAAATRAMQAGLIQPTDWEGWTEAPAFINGRVVSYAEALGPCARARGVPSAILLLVPHSAIDLGLLEELPAQWGLELVAARVEAYLFELPRDLTAPSDCGLVDPRVAVDDLRDLVVVEHR